MTPPLTDDELGTALGRSVRGRVDDIPTITPGFDTVERRAREITNRRRVIAGATIGVLLAVTGVGIAQLTDTDDSSPMPVVTDITTTTTVAPDEDAEAEAPFSAPSDTTELAWSSGAGPGSREQGSITWAGSAFAAFSSRSSTATFVISADGREWTESSPFADDAVVLGVNGWGQNMVVWGRDRVSGRDLVSNAPRLAISGDGGAGWGPLGTDGLLLDQPPYVTLQATIQHAAVIDDTVVVAARFSIVDVDLEQAAVDAGLPGLLRTRGSTVEDRHVLVCTTPDIDDCERHEYEDFGMTSESLDPPSGESLYRSIGGGPFQAVELASSLALPSPNGYFGVVDDQFVIATYASTLSSTSQLVPVSIYTSADGGDWTVSPVTDELSGIVSTNTDLFAMRGTEVVRSSDGGRIWQSIAVPEGTTGILGAGPGGVVLAGVLGPDRDEIDTPDAAEPADVSYIGQSVERDGYTIWHTGPSPAGPGGFVVTDDRGNWFLGYTAPDAEPPLVLERGECPVVYELTNPETDEVLLQVTKEDLALVLSSPEFGPGGERRPENPLVVAWSPDGVDFRWQSVDEGFTPSGDERTATSVVSVIVGEDAMVAVVAERIAPGERDLGADFCGAVALTDRTIPRIHTVRLK